MAICLLFPPFILSNSFISLAWDKNSENDLAGYRIYWSKSPAQFNNFIDVGDRTQYKLYDIDESVKYYIVLTAFDWWGNESDYSNVVTSWIGEQPQVPKELVLGANYPNPFNPGTFLDVTLPNDVELQINVYNIIGQKMKNIVKQKLDAGYHSIYWDGKDDNGMAVPAGVYIIRLETNNEKKVQLVTLVR